MSNNSINSLRNNSTLPSNYLGQEDVFIGNDPYLTDEVQTLDAKRKGLRSNLNDQSFETQSGTQESNTQSSSNTKSQSIFGSIDSTIQMIINSLQGIVSNDAIQEIIRPLTEKKEHEEEIIKQEEISQQQEIENAKKQEEIQKKQAYEFQKDQFRGQIQGAYNSFRTALETMKTVLTNNRSTERDLNSANDGLDSLFGADMVDITKPEDLKPVTTISTLFNTNSNNIGAYLNELKELEKQKEDEAAKLRKEYGDYLSAHGNDYQSPKANEFRDKIAALESEAQRYRTLAYSTDPIHQGVTQEANSLEHNIKQINQTIENSRKFKEKGLTLEDAERMKSQVIQDLKSLIRGAKGTLTDEDLKDLASGFLNQANGGRASQEEQIKEAQKRQARALEILKNDKFNKEANQEYWDTFQLISQAQWQISGPGNNIDTQEQFGNLVHEIMENPDAPQSSYTWPEVKSDEEITNNIYGINTTTTKPPTNKKEGQEIIRKALKELVSLNGEGGDFNLPSLAEIDDPNFTISEKLVKEILIRLTSQFDKGRYGIVDPREYQREQAEKQQQEMDLWNLERSLGGNYETGPNPLERMRLLGEQRLKPLREAQQRQDERNKNISELEGITQQLQKGLMLMTGREQGYGFSTPQNITASNSIYRNELIALAEQKEQEALAIRGADPDHRVDVLRTEALVLRGEADAASMNIGSQIDAHTSTALGSLGGPISYEGYLHDNPINVFNNQNPYLQKANEDMKIAVAQTLKGAKYADLNQQIASLRNWGGPSGGVWQQRENLKLQLAIAKNPGLNRPPASKDVIQGLETQLQNLIKEDQERQDKIKQLTEEMNNVYKS